MRASPRQNLLSESWSKLRAAGIIVDRAESNLSIVNGRPFFFEVVDLNPLAMRAHLETGPLEVRERVESMMEKLYEVRAKYRQRPRGLVSMLMKRVLRRFR
ncbi:hypothetical protein H0O03_03295 [Candidatus Micrarchaeota archaeon]|nr:hypothetical protein [Candidatus Micrarchaeota archaeon]